MAKKKKPAEKPKVHPDLKGFSIEVDEFGEIKMNRTAEEMSRFLKEHLPDNEAIEAEKKAAMEEE